MDDTNTSTIPWGQFGKAAGYGSMASGLLGMFMGNGQNPANSAMPYLNNISNINQKYLSPYSQAGQNALGTLNTQYANILSNPGAFMNSMGASYHQSPGFQFALHQALNSADNSQAASGMAGTPQNTQQDMMIGTQMGNQDYYNYLSRVLGLYGQGMEGEQNIFDTGATVADQMATNESQAQEEMAQAAYEGQKGQNAANGSFINDIGQGIGDLASFSSMFGG